MITGKDHFCFPMYIASEREIWKSLRHDICWGMYQKKCLLTSGEQDFFTQGISAELQCVNNALLYYKFYLYQILKYNIFDLEGFEKLFKRFYNADLCTNIDKAYDGASVSTMCSIYTLHRLISTYSATMKLSYLLRAFIYIYIKKSLSEMQGGQCWYSIHMGSTPRSPWDWDENRQATLCCVNLLSGAWQRSARQAGAGHCLEIWRASSPLMIITFYSTLAAWLADVGHYYAWYLVRVQASYSQQAAQQRDRTLSSQRWNKPKGSSVKENILSSRTSCLVRHCQQDRSGRHAAKDRSMNANRHLGGRLCFFKEKHHLYDAA